ncbi:hypothetical protein [Fodinicurvata sp. EGI_FJ10296]|uniref:hypothetical protein n=1 Tax=Fodinicurvata sp. EGI_FJ10296 TaxID=3231908 RepID=UPI003456C5E2
MTAAAQSGASATLATMRLLRRLRQRQWVSIASTCRGGDDEGAWRSMEGAPLTIRQARRLYDDGHIELAQSRRDDRFELLAYRRRRTAVRPVLWGKGA